MTKLYESKGIYPERSYRDLRSILDETCSRYGERDAYWTRERPRGETIKHTFNQLRSDIDALGTSLLFLDLVNSDRSSHIGIIGENSYEWVLASNSAVMGAGISVPLDKQLSNQEIISLLKRGKIEVFFFSKSYLKVAQEAADQVPSIKALVGCNCSPADLAEVQAGDKRFYRLQDLLELGQDQIAQGNNLLRQTEIDPEAMSFLLFTSGTTDLAKGVMLSQAAIVKNVSMTLQTVKVDQDGPEGKRHLSILPLHHVYESTLGMYCMWASGSTICINDSLRYIAYNLSDWQINIVLAVPLLLENIYKQIHTKIKQQGKEKTVNRAIKLSNFLRKLGIDLRRQLFKSIHQPLGGKLEQVFVGAAPLSREIHQFFNDIGILCYTGYGLTETAPLLCGCNDRCIVPGTIGQPLPGVKMKIDFEDSLLDDHGRSVGEILVHTPSLMLGYYEDEAVSHAAMTDDGWFKTGDVGFFDERGLLQITGRSKSMIVLTNGKKVFPEELEFLLGQIPGIRASMVFGEANERGIIEVVADLQLDLTKLPEDPADRESFLRRAIEQVNERMPSYKKIKYFVWRTSAMITTTTLKVKRQAETDSIRARLAARGWSMRQADGQQIDA